MKTDSDAGEVVQPRLVRRCCDSCRFFKATSDKRPMIGECEWDGPRPSHYQRPYGASTRIETLPGGFGENCDAWCSKEITPYDAVFIAAKAATNVLKSERDHARKKQAQADEMWERETVRAMLAEQDLAEVREIIEKGGSAKDVLKFIDTPKA